MRVHKIAMFFAGLGSATLTVASPISHHHHYGIGLADACDSTEPAVCLVFVGDKSIANPVPVTEKFVTVANGKSQQGSYSDFIGPYNSFEDELDLSEAKALKVTRFDVSFSSVAGKSVNHLCQVNLTAQDFNTPKQITMTLHVDSFGNYSCKRS